MNISKNMKAVMVVALGVAAGCLLTMCIVGCDLPEPPPKFHKETNKTDQIDTLNANWDYIQVVRDEKRQVTCWVTSGTGGGISCLPDQINKLP